MKVLSLSLEFFNDGAFDEQNFLGEQTTALNYESQKKKKRGRGLFLLGVSAALHSRCPVVYLTI